MTSSNDREDKRHLFKAYAAKNRQEVSGCYDIWAEDHETRMKNVGYLHPAMVDWTIRGGG